MKERLTSGIIWLFLVFVTIASVRGYILKQQDYNRVIYDLKASRDSARTFTTRDNHQASKLIAQNLTVSELKKVDPETVSKLKNLYIPPRLVQSYTEASQTMNVEVKAAVKDSIVARTPIGEPEGAKSISPERVQTISYSDAWIKIKGVLYNDTAALKIAATDTIFTAIYRGERRHPWAWFLSKRQLTAAATNRSPYIKIKVIQSGVIKK